MLAIAGIAANAGLTQEAACWYARAGGEPSLRYKTQGLAMRIFPTQGRPETVLGRFVVGRPRLLASLGAGVLGFLLLELSASPLVTRLLLAWNIGTWLYIGALPLR